MQWTFQHLSSEFGNIWRTIQTRSICINWPTCLQFLVAHLYKHMNDNNSPILQFNLADESIDDTASIWTLFSHTEIYIMAIGPLIPAGLGIFCYYFFWCWPAILTHHSFWSCSLQHIIVYDVEAAPIYRSESKAGQPVIRPCKNHDLCMKWEPTKMESQQKQHTLSKAVPKSGSLDTKTQNPGNTMNTHGLL